MKRIHEKTPGLGGPTGRIERSHSRHNAEPLLSVPEAAARLGIGKRSVWRMLDTGELPSIRLGRRRLIDPRDLASLIERRREGGR